MAKKYKKNWQEKKNKKQKFELFSQKNILGAFIVLIMVTSGIGFAVTMNSEDDNSYNGIDFVRGPNSYIGKVKINGEKTDMEFTYHPTNVDHIKIDNGFLEKLQNVPSLRILFDPNDKYIDYVEYARTDIESYLRAKETIFESSVTEESDSYAFYSTATCDNATEYIPAIYIKSSADINSTGFSVKGNCFVFEAQDEYDVILLKDRLLYGLTDVII